MADKTTKIIEIEVELEGGEKVTKQFEKLSDGTLKAVDSAQKLDATFDDVYNGMAPLTARMGEAEDRLYELSLAGDTASKEYQELLNKVGEYRKVQIQTDLAVDQAAQTMSQKLGSALTGAASGFTAATGVIGLMGSESEELEKLLLKVNAAMAFQQGIQGVIDYTKSLNLANDATKKGGVVQKAFNLIMAANPAALFVLGITALVTSLFAFTEMGGQAIQMLKDFSDAIGITNFEEDKLAEERNERSRQHLAQMKAEQTLRDAEIRQLEALGKSTTKLRRQQIEEEKASLKATAERLRLTNEGFQSVENYISGKEKEAELSATEIEVQAQIIALETELINLEKEEQQEIKNLNDTYADYAARRLSVARLIQDLELEILEDGVEKEVEISNVKFDRLLEDLKTNTELTAKERKRLTELYLFQQQEAENDIRNQFRQDQLNAEKEFGVESINVSELTANKEVETTFNKYAAMGAISMEYYKGEEERRKEDREKLFEGIEKGLEMAEKASAATQALGDAVFAHKMIGLEKGSEEEEKVLKKQFKFNKALQLSGAVIDAAKAITSSLSQSPIAIGPVPNPAGIASLAFAATTGAANIATIAATQFESTRTDVDTPSPDLGGGGAPQFNVVGDSGVNQLAQLQQQPTQAYVVSGEVTTAQALDRNRVQNATL